jgi:NCAIR mutase (PurE)-related protein
LEELYGDPNKERNARQGFKDLVMKRGQTFQEFYAQFLRLVADGNISSQDLKDELNDKLTWKLQEAVATYYNNPNVTTTAFARHCTTNDQQIRARLDKRERLPKAENLKKPSYESGTKDKTSKLTSTSKTTSASTEANPETQKLGSGGRSDLKCYNCNKFGHISKYCPEARTEATTLALARMAKGSDADNELGNDKP